MGLRYFIQTQQPMDHSYTTKDGCKLVTTSGEIVRFLLDYSKSLSVISSRGMDFENNLN